VPLTPRTGFTRIWGTSYRAGGRHHRYVLRLIEKHWGAIAARCDADMPHLPEIDRFGEELLGSRWAQGFLSGLGLFEESWENLFPNDRLSALARQIVALANDISMPKNQRTGIVDQLPHIVQTIAGYWYHSSAPMSFTSDNADSDQQCVCGSGKKYKNCCGFEGPTFH
jgi:yecA family protein